MLIGTIIDTVVVITGSLIGVLFRKNFSKKIKNIIFQGIGLSILLIGIQMALKVENLLILIISILLGSIIGEFIQLENRFESLSDFLKNKIKSRNPQFTEGLISAFLICCVGSMTIIGALNEGIKNDSTILLTKSILDFFTTIILASTYGEGVLFLAIPLFIYQSSLTLMGIQFGHLFSSLILNQLTAVGGILIIGVSLNLLKIKKINVTNLLPSILIVIILTLIF